MKELFKTMQEDVLESGHLSDGYLKLLEALSEKKQEPKSTLRESGAKIVYEYLRQSGITFNTIDSKRIADEIISLFKDTLLKEMQIKIDNAEPGNYEENNFEAGVIEGLSMIKLIVKNL